MIHISLGSLLSCINTKEDEGLMICTMLFPGMFPPFGEESSRPQRLLHPVLKLTWEMIVQHDFGLTIDTLASTFSQHFYAFY